jgi:4-amino-4-deoxy-L-arabinose transferase-like glycosyltransferase
MVVRYDKSQSLRSSLLIGVVIGIGALAREIVFMFLPFLVLYELTKEKRSIAKILLVIAVSVIPAIIWCYFIGSNYISNFVDNLSHYGGTADSTFGALLTSVFYAFPLSMFILPGFMEENDRKKLRFHYSYLATAAFFVVAWTYYHYRLTFILFPSVLPLTVKGLRWFANKTSEKPILRRIKPAHWELIMLIMYIAFTNHYGLRYVSLPGGPGVRT